MFKKLVLCICVVALLVGVFASWIYFNSRNAIRHSINADSSFFGVGEPLSYRSSWSNESLNATQAFEAIQYLNVSYLREWVWRWMIFNEDGVGLRSNMVSSLNNISSKAKDLNITVIGMVQDFPSWMTNFSPPITDGQVVPKRNLTEGSTYRIFLGNYEQSWKILAETFPNITLWEIGNEYNLHPYLHPSGYVSGSSSTWFSFQETVDIVTDLLYYGSIGIHEGNPEATTVMCGLGPLEFDLDSIKTFLNAIYQNIESSSWPSTNSDDFFEIACWHPYLNSIEPNQLNWVDPNNAIRSVMIDHGDDNKSVIFSEFGYSNKHTGLGEAQVSEYLFNSYRIAAESFKPWLRTICWFRLVDPDPKYDHFDNPAEYGFGLFKKTAVGFVPKFAAETFPAH
jgi:hypothetical protein